MLFFNMNTYVTATGLEPITSLASLAKWLSVRLRTKWLLARSPVAVT